MINKLCEEEYIRRIHRVQDYIESHLDRSMSLEELAKAAGFSKYHFSRIFQGILHESLAHYVNRIRMENAAFLLAHRKDKNMTEIAYELGFTDSAVFSRAFSNWYHISPSKYRSEYSKKCKETVFISEYNEPIKKKEWAQPPFKTTGEIKVTSLEDFQVVYVRHVGTYESLAHEYGKLLEKLFQGAEKQQLLLSGFNEVFTMYHDNPEFGENKQYRTSICLKVPEGSMAKEDDILGVMKVEGGSYAVGHFEIGQEDFVDAWDYMYQQWLTGSGYVPRNTIPFEVYLNNPNEDKNGVIKVEICVPIEPISF